MRKTVFLFVLLSLFSVITTINFSVKPVFSATTYLSESFETFPTGWNVAGNPFIPTKTTEQKYSGSYSGVTNNIILTQYGYAYKTVTSTPKNDYRIGEWVYPSSSVNALNLQLGGCYNTTTNTYNFVFGLNCSNGVFYLMNQLNSTLPTVWENVGILSNNTWHYIEAYFSKSSTKIHYYINGVNQSSSYSSLNNVFPERFYFGDTSATSFMGKFFIDDLIIDDSSEPITTEPQYNTSTSYYNTNNSDSISTWKLFSFWWGKNSNLSGFFYCHNQSGSLVNDTWTSFDSLNNSWANKTFFEPRNVGNSFSWKVYANNSDNNWNVTTLLTQPYSAIYTFYFNSENVTIYRDLYTQIISNGTSFTYFSVTWLYILSCPNKTTTFLNWSFVTGTYRYAYANPLVLEVTNSSVIWCYVEQSSVSITNGTFIYSKFTVNNSAPYQDEYVFFDGTSSNASSPITSFLWNFGDNTTLEGNTTTHKYLVDGIFTVNLTVVSGSMVDTSLFQITVLATIITVNFDLPFFLLIFLVSVCLILCVFRIPIIGFVFSAFAIGFSAWTLVYETLPLYGLLNMFVAVIGAICLYLNIIRFKELSITKKHTSKLAKRF